MTDIMILNLRDEMKPVSAWARQEIVSQLHQLAGLIALDNKEAVLKLIQDLDRIFEPNDE